MLRSGLVIAVAAVLGAAAGYVVSYWFQPSLLQAMMDLGDYITDADDVFEGLSSVRRTAVTGLVVGAVAGVAAGFGLSGLVRR